MIRISFCIAAALLGACATTQPATPPADDVLEGVGLPERAPAVKPADRPVPTAMPITVKALRKPPPMTIVSLPVPNKPIVSIRLVFRAGAIDDPAGKEGLTSLTTELMSQGGTASLTASQLLDALFPMAAELEASTEKEFTVFTGRVHRDKLPAFLKIFTEVLLKPRWDPKEFARLKAQTRNHVTHWLRGENDEELGKIGLDALLYPGHPYRHYNSGTVAGIDAITLDDVKAQAKRVFTQDRLVVGLAGATDAALESQVKMALAKLPATGAALIELPEAPGVRGKTLILKKDALSTAISMGFSTPLRRDDPDYYAVAFAMSYLGEHRQFHGVLFTELREKRGLNYGDYAYVEHYRQAGENAPRNNMARTSQDMSIWVRPVEPQNAVFATRGTLYFLNEMLNKPIPKENFETARGFLTGATRLWEQTDQRRLGYAIDALFYGTPNFLEDYRNAMATLTPEQMQAAMRKYVDAGNLNFVFVAKDAEALKVALTTQAPTMMSYPTPKDEAVLKTDKAISAYPLPMHPSLIEIVDAQSFMEK
ncbi:MAG: insulinase family protein [Myxococcaceae bacterium]|nr:insulinase family protein [Myxococcaceae bacterium]